MDVKMTFLNGVIEEEIYIEWLEGFEVHGRDSHVCKVEESIVCAHVGFLSVVCVD